MLFSNMGQWDKIFWLMTVRHHSFFITGTAGARYVSRPQPNLKLFQGDPLVGVSYKTGMAGAWYGPYHKE